MSDKQDKYVRPKTTEGPTVEFNTGCGKIYITINHDDEPDKPMEIFARLGNSGGCSMAATEAICRMISLSLKDGTDPADIVNQLSGIRCDKPHIGTALESTWSCADAIAKALKYYMADYE